MNASISALAPQNLKLPWRIVTSMDRIDFREHQGLPNGIISKMMTLAMVGVVAIVVNPSSLARVYVIIVSSRAKVHLFYEVISSDPLTFLWND